MKATYRILVALPEHITALSDIERAAANLFPEEVLPNDLRNQTISIETLEVARQRRLLWVTVDTDNHPVGFVLVDDHGTTLHLEELDVHPDHQRQGIGRAMLEMVYQYALDAGYEGITLTTYSDIPWNAPWYKMLGFKVLKPVDLNPRLCAIMEAEAQRGLDPRLRVAMLKRC